MSSDWLASLSSLGGRLEGAALLDFGDPDAELAAADGDVVTVLTDYGVIAVTGSDATTLLQGQMTADLREVDPRHSRLGGVCSPKGRMLASVRAIGTADGYLLVLPAALLPEILKRLQMYVLRADVQLTDATAGWVILGLQGTAVMAAAGIDLAALDEGEDTLRAGEVIATRLPPGRRPRCLALAPAPAAGALLEACAAAGRPVGHEAWALTEVEAAVPEILPETQESFVPQMVNLQALGGVSFTKGCYAGQEVVARMQYLGTLKRRMYRARAAVDEVPAPGAPLYAPASPGGQSVGRVVRAARSPAGGVELLAVAQIKSAEEDTLHLESPDGPRLELLELPYALDA